MSNIMAHVTPPSSSPVKLRPPGKLFDSNHHDSTDDDGAWEDLVTSKARSSSFKVAGSVRSESPTASVRSQFSPARKRKPPKTIFVAASPRRQTTSSAPKKRSQAMSTGATHTGRYALDVFTTSVWLLRKPLSFILFLWLLALILIRVNHTLRTAFAPLCYIPGISRSALCAPASRQGLPKWADYPNLMNVQSATFEQLLDESVGGSGLALEIKKAEMATVDLGTLVRVSNLKSRDLIAETLAEFVEDARKTGKGLQKLSSKVGGAVDSILAANDYALHTIEEAIVNQPSGPFGSKRSPNEIVTRTFIEAMDQLAFSMRRLIIEAEVSLANLDKLETRLSTLHELVSREDSSLSSAKSELLSELWTKVGGNKRTLRGYDEHLYLLKNLGDYRKRALVHVVAALQMLQAMSEDMEDMRERVGAPELLGSSIPVEVHIRSIRSGLERLKEGRIKAKEREEEAVRRILVIGPGE